MLKVSTRPLLKEDVWELTELSPNFFFHFSCSTSSSPGTPAASQTQECFNQFTRATSQLGLQRCKHVFATLLDHSRSRSYLLSKSTTPKDVFFRTDQTSEFSYCRKSKDSRSNLKGDDFLIKFKPTFLSFNQLQ